MNTFFFKGTPAAAGADGAAGAAKGRERAPACKWGALWPCPTPALTTCATVGESLLLGPGALVKTQRAPCSALSELRPRSLRRWGWNTTPVGSQGRFISLFTCLFSCRQWGHLPGLQQPPLCSSFSAVAVCLTHLFSGLPGSGWVPSSSCPLPLPLPPVNSPRSRGRWDKNIHQHF